MAEPTMRELRASRTHTARCSILQRGAMDGERVCVCWCHDEQRPRQAAPLPSPEPHDSGSEATNG